ncbi:uncharacterized protein K489DRAFT_99127 [Dissoconium aciculare CBS 342.82]|uniref:Uncharacterized protein n=1 Tax=Dissoconium aciculare CBS 342.82 TaxID=1314786 RepID=A0A6J3MCR4_9PEZI|nr:uncharacterized protein K489DRAFT_99127 [Dissoconium aciculare CBS 342.82]KAF1825815.1 hypothetical protein K489DRAFT_99127 [Dissoconium aciculare CBS 342.82]
MMSPPSPNGDTAGLGCLSALSAARTAAAARAMKGHSVMTLSSEMTGSVCAKGRREQRPPHHYHSFASGTTTVYAFLTWSGVDACDMVLFTLSRYGTCVFSYKRSLQYLLGNPSSLVSASVARHGSNSASLQYMYPMPHINRNFYPRVSRSKDSGQAFASGRSSALEAISFLVASSVSSLGDSGLQPYRTLMSTSTKPHRTVPDGSRPCSRPHLRTSRRLRHRSVCSLQMTDFLSPISSPRQTCCRTELMRHLSNFSMRHHSHQRRPEAAAIQAASLMRSGSGTHAGPSPSPSSYLRRGS